MTTSNNTLSSGCASLVFLALFALPLSASDLTGTVFLEGNVAPAAAPKYMIGRDGALGECIVFLYSGFSGYQTKLRNQLIEIAHTDNDYSPRYFAAMVGDRLRLNMKCSQSKDAMIDSKYSGILALTELAPGQATADLTFLKPEWNVRIESSKAEKVCYISVFDHPFFDVTKGDGRFAIGGNLADGQYGIAAVHSSRGIITNLIVVKDGKGSVDFTYHIKSPVLTINEPFWPKSGAVVEVVLDEEGHPMRRQTRMGRPALHKALGPGPERESLKKDVKRDSNARDRADPDSSVGPR